MTDSPKPPPEGFSLLPVTDSFMDHVGPVYVKQGEGTEIHMGFWVERHHCNPIGICHGGMLMTLMDTALSLNVSTSREGGAFTPTINLTYDFVAPGRVGDWLQSKIEWVHTGRKTGFATGFLLKDGTPIMRASVVCKILRKDDPRFDQPASGTFAFPPKED